MADPRNESKAATEIELQLLHKLVADLLLNELLAADNHCPTCRRSHVSPSLVRAACKFLADNNIVVDANEMHDLQRSLSQLAGLQVPFKSRN